MYLLDVSIRYLKYFCVLFVLFVFLFMLLASLRCYTSIFDGFIIISFTVSTQTEEEYQAWARSRDEATSTPTTTSTSSTTSPPTTTSKVSLSDREGEDEEVVQGSAYDYVADEGDYYNTELDDKRRITTSTPETTKATHRITSTTTAMPTTASPVSSTSTATYVGDYEDVDSHMARVGQEPDICVGLLDR